MDTILHSQGVGRDEAILPRRIKLEDYKIQQARISRKSLFKTSAWYTTYALILLYMTLRSRHPFVGVIFFVVGMASYTLIEYLSHRWMFHFKFKTTGIEGLLHRIFDSVHN